MTDATDATIPMISYWYGQPVSEMGREELETGFIAAQLTILSLKQEMTESTASAVRDLAHVMRSLTAHK